MESVAVFKLDNSRTRYLRCDEAERSLAACEPDFRPIVLTALRCGFRKSKLKTLQWQNINLDDRSITILSCYSKNKQPRTVPMTKEVFETFKRLREERPERKPEEVVLVNPYTNATKAGRRHSRPRRRMRASESPLP